ncbi:MAG TPA: cytochrome c-type biogenesis CcmF C-terminal domain-containing protein [Solirubrobacteraceae bacterium]|jgi:cytochrome c-type biogenesis protein CcmF|nr:cytochrome c-type biogenesis CcmF C-terminal domain-containing protein [Solirubrobacteraceae bacterium]
MAVLGRACLLLALLVCVYGIGASLYGVRRGRSEWCESGRRAVYALALILTVAFVVLEIAFMRNEFSFNAVADTSSTNTPTFYKFAAVWSSQEGSLLLWAWLSAMWSSLILFLTRNRMRDITPYAQSVLLGFAGFFVGLMIFYASPFDTTSPAPTAGAGLDPLLRFWTMMIHPPMLYSGYTLCIVPFAFGVGALIARRVDAEWIRATRRFALASWLFLGLGILLGARWSYSELGWGGYWGWDAVENAALLPWLTGTAFIHSIMIQEKRGMLKVWNASLVLATGTLAIMGTFLVRSGILDSIHAFGASTLGVPFVVLIAVCIFGSIYLVVSRRDMLRTEHRLDSLFSREAAFLLNNLVLVGLAFVIMWGTYFPLISEAFTGSESSVGPPWFDRYTVPLALILVLLSGVGPLLSWRRATGSGARRNLIVPATAFVLVLVGAIAAGVPENVKALLMFACAAFAIAAVGQEFVRGTRVRRALSGEATPLAMFSLVRRNRRRYGGYLVHVGIAVMFVGVAASSSFAHQNTDVPLGRGQSTKVGAYKVTYVRPTAVLHDAPSVDGELRTALAQYPQGNQIPIHHDGGDLDHVLDLGAVLDVTKNGHHVATLRPMMSFYNGDDPSQGTVGDLLAGQSVSDVGLNSSPLRDLWSAFDLNLAQTPLQSIINRGNAIVPANRPDLALVTIAALAGSYLEHPPAAEFNLLISPLVMWLWVGGLIVLGGGLLAGSPSGSLVRGRASARVAARATRGMARA